MTNLLQRNSRRRVYGNQFVCETVHALCDRWERAWPRIVVEAFYLAVLPGTVGFDEDLSGMQRGADLAQGVAVGPGVIGHDWLDAGDAVVMEVGGWPFSSGKISE